MITFRLLSWCRSEPNASFNREAWHLFYKIIQYHTGVFDFLKGNILEKFLETIGTASHPVVVENGLRWLNKVFNLPAEEQKLAKPSRIDKEPYQCKLSMLTWKLESGRKRYQNSGTILCSPHFVYQGAYDLQKLGT